MNPKDTAFVTYKRRRGRYNRNLDLEEINLEDTKSEDMTNSQDDKGKGTSKEVDRMAFHSLVSALNDLSKGQKEMLQLINRLVDKPGQDQNKLQAQGDRASTSNNGRLEYTTM